MAPNSTDTGERLTPLAALLNAVTTSTMQRSLGTYLAVARIPGPEWKSFDDIADDLTAMISGVRTLNRVSIRKFAESYGIPDTRYVEGRSMPRPVTVDAVSAYIDELRAAGRPGVDLDTVDREADAAVNPVLASALANSAEGNVTDGGDFTDTAKI